MKMEKLKSERGEKTNLGTTETRCEIKKRRGEKSPRSGTPRGEARKVKQQGKKKDWEEKKV